MKIKKKRNDIINKQKKKKSHNVLHTYIISDFNCNIADQST